MKHLDEYRDRRSAELIIGEIGRLVTRPWTIMEVCGGQTHSIVRYGIDALLPEGVELLHGPGCPVCVTPLEMIDRAHVIARSPGVVFCSFGDMLRVPGSHGDLFSLRSLGADVRVVYSPLDAVRLARELPEKRIVFFAVGFETTAPANAMAVRVAHREGLTNFSLLVSHVLVPPAIASILQAPDNRVQAFLGPGHVCTVMGTSEYEALAARYRVPIAITGFEPVDLLQGLLTVLRRLEKGEAVVDIPYSRVVRAGGNEASRRLVASTFDVCDRKWRGIGTLGKSGLRLSWEYRAHDAERIFEVEDLETRESERCISGKVLRGLAKPDACPAFGRDCTPESPLGATMVSDEGACAAYYRYGRHLVTLESRRELVRS